MRLNAAPVVRKTDEGASAISLSPEQELSRVLMSCMLWEDSFYESGIVIADRLEGCLLKVSPEVAAKLVRKARFESKLRHAPLWLTRLMAKHPKYRSQVKPLLSEIILRPAEAAEALAMYWKDGKEKLTRHYTAGIGEAFKRFDEYQLAKYNRNSAVKLRDVLRICHPKPKDEEQSKLWKRLLSGELQTPDTWEVAISAAKSPEEKKAQWQRLVTENKLGPLALMRNLRNIYEAGVNNELIRNSIKQCNPAKLLPFQIIAAAIASPQNEDVLDVLDVLEGLILKMLEGESKLAGKTAILVDVSNSMTDSLSAKSTMKRQDAACGLAILAKELCEESLVFSFSDCLTFVANRRGFALRDAILNSQQRNGTYLGGAVAKLCDNRDKFPFERLIVITDEQSADSLRHPGKGIRSYIINIGPYDNSVGYGDWIRINGFSENTISFIAEYENAEKVTLRA